MHLLIRYFLSAFFLLTSTTLWAQQPCTITLSGIVQDTDGNPLPGAAVLIHGKGESTDDAGKFIFKELCAGDFELLVKYVGFDDSITKIELTRDRQLIITLEPGTKLLEAVEIISGSSHAGLTNSSYRLSEKELHHFKGKSLGEALKRVPGVSAMQTGPSVFKPVIDGLHSQRILVLNNGIRQEGQQWGVEHAPEIDPFIASEIQVIKGSETVRYGSDAIGGAIIIDTPPLHQTRKLGGEMNMGAFSNNRMGVFSAMLEGGFIKTEKLSWRIQSSLKKGGDFSAPDYVLSNTGVEELNFSGALGYKGEGKGVELYISSFNTEIGILRASHTGNLDDLDNSIRTGVPWYIEDFTFTINPPKQKINHQLVKLSAFKNISGVGKLNILCGGQFDQRKEFDTRRGGRSDIPALSLNLISNVCDVSLDHEIGKVEGSVGINATFKDNSNVPGTGIRPLIPNYNQFNGGIFVHEKFRKKNWLLEAGVRYDHQYLNVRTFINNQDLIEPEFNFDYVSGSLGASYYFNPNTRFSSHIGISARPPHVSELYSEGLHHGTASIEEGLMRQNGEVFTDQYLIKNEVSRKWINSFQITRKKFSVELSAYYNYISNYVFLKPAGTRLTIRGYFPVLVYDQTDALLLGTDGLVHWDISKHFEYAGTFALLYAEDITNDDVLTWIPPAQIENAITYTFKTGKLKDLFVTVRVPTAFKQNRAPVTVYPKDITDYEGQKIYDFAPAPAAYTLLNIEAGVKVPLKNRELSISLTGENLLNKSYRVYMNRLRYFADEPGCNFIVRIKYNFHSHT